MIFVRLLVAYWSFQWIQAKTKLFMLATAFLFLDHQDIGHKILEASYFCFAFLAGLIFDPLFILFSKKDENGGPGKFVEFLQLVYLRKRMMDHDEFEDWVVAQTK